MYDLHFMEKHIFDLRDSMMPLAPIGSGDSISLIRPPAKSLLHSICRTFYQVQMNVISKLAFDSHAVRNKSA